MELTQVGSFLWRTPICGVFILLRRYNKPSSFLDLYKQTTGLFWHPSLNSQNTLMKLHNDIFTINKETQTWMKHSISYLLLFIWKEWEEGYIGKLEKEVKIKREREKDGIGNKYQKRARPACYMSFISLFMHKL